MEDGTFYNPTTKETCDLSTYNPGGKSLAELRADRTPPDPNDRKKDDASFDGSPSRQDQADLQAPPAPQTGEALTWKGWNAQFLGGKGVQPIKGGLYGAERDSGKRTHAGLDIPAAEGTEIRVPSLGVPLTVLNPAFP